MEYKSYRIVDGKPRWVIVDENGKIVNKEPDKEEIKGLEKEIYCITKKIYYNQTNTCEKCGDKLFPHTNACEIYDKIKGIGIWLCAKCYRRYDYLITMKPITSRVLCNLNPNSESAKGDRFQLLTCLWRSTVSTIPVEDLNKKLDCYNTPIDHSRDSELGIMQTAGRYYDEKYGRWPFAGLDREHSKEFDNMICYCASKDGKIIERIYIIPWEEIIERKGMAILKNLHYGGWYEEYRVNNETVDKVNKIYQTIIRQ